MAKRPSNDDDAPEAASITWFLCPECEDLHVHLRDKKDKAFGFATLNRETLVQMLEMIDGSPVSGSTVQ